VGKATSTTSATSSIGLPVVANAGQGYTSGVSILNTSASAVSGSIRYYNPDGSVVAGVAAQNFTLGAHASLPAYQGAAGLPSGFYGSALVTITSSNGAGALVATTNVQSATLFYTYNLASN
jgi:hypothetical protein